MAVTLVNEKEPDKKRIGRYYKPWPSNSRKNYFLSEKKKSVAAAGPFVRSNVLL